MRAESWATGRQESKNASGASEEARNCSSPGLPGMGDCSSSASCLEPIIEKFAPDASFSKIDLTPLAPAPAQLSWTADIGSHSQAPLVAELERHLLAYVGASTDAYAFTAEAGTPLDANNFRSRVWNSATHSAGLAGLRFDLRHTAGTLAARTGATTEELMAASATPARRQR